jgi:hypothetical protein
MHPRHRRFESPDYYNATPTNDNALFSYRRLLRRYGVGRRNKLEEQAELNINLG